MTTTWELHYVYNYRLNYFDSAIKTYDVLCPEMYKNEKQVKLIG